MAGGKANKSSKADSDSRAVSYHWSEPTDVKLAREVAALKVRYCPTCLREYAWDRDCCEVDGTPLSYRSVFGRQIGDDSFDALSLSLFFERVCPRCGATFEDGVTRCMEDGAPLVYRKRLPSHAEEEPDPRQKIGEIFGSRWRVTEFLSGGGFGWVFKGEGVGLGQPVAIKLLKIDLEGAPSYRQLFHTEATILSSLDYPRIVRIIDYGEEGDVPYLVMQYLSAIPLSRFILQGQLLLDEKVEIMRQVALALAEAHREDPKAGKRRVVHLDLKPEHVFIGRQQGELHVTVIDFGVAEIISGAEHASTQCRPLVGTLPYMAPERFDGDVDPRCDIYSFGAVFYELLTGTKPLVASSVPEFEEYHKEVPAPPLRRDATGRKVPRSLRRLIERTLAKRKEDRPQTAREVASEIQGWLSTKRWSKALSWAAAALVLAALVLASYQYFRPSGAGIVVEDVYYRQKEDSLEVDVGVFSGWTMALELMNSKGRRKSISGAVTGTFAEFRLPGDIEDDQYRGVVVASEGWRGARSGAFTLVVDTEKPELVLEDADSRNRLVEDSVHVVEKGERLRIGPRPVETGVIHKCTWNGEEKRLDPDNPVISVFTLFKERTSDFGELIITATDKSGNCKQKRFYLALYDQCSLTQLKADAEPGKHRPEGDILRALWTYSTRPMFTGTVRGHPRNLRVFLDEGDEQEVACVVNRNLKRHSSDNEDDNCFKRLSDGLYAFEVEVAELKAGKENDVLFVLEDLRGNKTEEPVVVDVCGGKLEVSWKIKEHRIVILSNRRNVEVEGVLRVLRSLIDRSDSPDSKIDRAEIPLQPLADGVYELRGTARDDYGYEADIGPFEFTVDKSAPEVAVELAESRGELTNYILEDSGEQATFEVTVDVDLTRVEVSAVLDGRPLGSPQYVEGGTRGVLAFTIPSEKLKRGENVIKVKAKECRTKGKSYPADNLRREFTRSIYEGPKGPFHVMVTRPGAGEIVSSSDLHVTVEADWTVSKILVNGSEAKAISEHGMENRRFDATVTKLPKDAFVDQEYIKIEAVSYRGGQHELPRFYIRTAPDDREKRYLVDKLENKWPMVYIKGKESGFFVLSHPVTLGEFNKVMGYQDVEGTQILNHPVNYITREKALAFLKKIGEDEGHFELPSFKQWEEILFEKKGRELRTTLTGLEVTPDILEWLAGDTVSGTGKAVVLDWPEYEKPLYERLVPATNSDAGFRFVITDENWREYLEPQQ